MGHGSDRTARTRIVQTLVEGCWADQAGLDRMAELVAPGYVHHTAWGDWDLSQFLTGMEYVHSLFADRTYRVMHLIDDGTLIAAYLAWSGTRRSDGSLVEGRGAYHCRLEDGLVAEDWDAFFPSA